VSHSANAIDTGYHVDGDTAGSGMVKNRANPVLQSMNQKPNDDKELS